MRTTIENWQGTDSDLLVQLNSPTIKVLTPNPSSKPGRFGFRGMATVNTELAISFGFTLKSVADAMMAAVDNSGKPIVSQRALGTTILGFWHIFYTDNEGLNLADDELRDQLSQVLLGASWPQSHIDAILAFGYTLKSIAQRDLGRDATKDDINEVRDLISRETALDAIRQRANAADEAARIAFMAGETPEQITAAAVAAWGE